jgi:hypothetical protein
MVVNAYNHKFNRFQMYTSIRKVKMSVMILDAGNSIIKAKIARRERGEVAFPHALKQLDRSRVH